MNRDFCFALKKYYFFLREALRFAGRLAVFLLAGRLAALRFAGLRAFFVAFLATLRRFAGIIEVTSSRSLYHFF